MRQRREGSNEGYAVKGIITGGNLILIAVNDLGVRENVPGLYSHPGGMREWGFSALP